MEKENEMEKTEDTKRDLTTEMPLGHWWTMFNERTRKETLNRMQRAQRNTKVTFGWFRRNMLVLTT